MTSIATNAVMPGASDAKAQPSEPPEGGRPESPDVAGHEAGRPGLVDEAAPRSRSAAVLAFLSQGVSSATNFLRLVFITRVVTETQLGDYALGMTLVSWFMAVHEQLIATPYSVFAHRYEPAERGRLLGNTVLASWSATQVAALLVFLVGVVVSVSSSDQGMGLMLLMVGLTAPAIVLRELARTAAFTNFRMAAVLGIDLATLAVQVVLFGMLWSFDSVGLMSIYLAMAASCLLAVSGWLWAWRGRWFIDFTRLRFDWSQLWSYSRWLLAARLMGTLSRLMIPWVVLAMLGKVEAGLLATCVSLIGLAQMFVRGINNFARPYVIKSFNDGGVPAVRRAVTLTMVAFTVLLTPLCLLAAVAGDWLLVAIYGDKLAGAGLVVFAMAVSALVTAWATALAVGLLALGRPRDSLWFEGATLLGTAVSAPVLIAGYELVGAAGSMLAGNVAGCLVALVLFLWHSSAPKLEADDA